MQPSRATSALTGGAAPRFRSGSLAHAYGVVATAPPRRALPPPRRATNRWLGRRREEGAERIRNGPVVFDTVSSWILTNCFGSMLLIPTDFGVFPNVGCCRFHSLSFVPLPSIWGINSWKLQCGTFDLSNWVQWQCGTSKGDVICRPCSQEMPDFDTFDTTSVPKQE
jgi:hypothetical protein